MYWEVKGAQVSLCHERFFITSNYHPKDIFGEDEILLEAILRRFKIIHMVDKTLDCGATRSWTPRSHSWIADGEPTSTQRKILNVQLNYYGLFDS